MWNSKNSRLRRKSFLKLDFSCSSGFLFEKLIFRAELFLEISKPLPILVQMSIKIKIVWAFIDKDPETGNHLLSALHIFVLIFYHELENKNFWIHIYSHSVTIAIHPSIVGTDPIWFFFMNDILAESFTILNWTNMAKMPIIMLKFKHEFALIYLLI